MKFRSNLILLLAWLLPVTPATAQRKVVKSVTFLTSPASTIHAPSAVGDSGKPLPIIFVNGIAFITITRSDYQLVNVTLDISQASGGSYPPQGAVILVPNHFWIPVRDWIAENPALAVGGLLVGATCLGMGLRRRRTLLARKSTLGKFEERRDLHDSLAMQTVGGYVLVEALGAGGMATVYRGLPEETLDEKSAVAVKVLSRDMIGNVELRERFRREVNAYRKLTHPNIVSLYDWGEIEGGMIYIVLELVNGETLRDRLGKGPLPPAELKEMLASLCAALHYAHGEGIIHRDLKPENLMITRAGQLKVMDYGLARHQGADPLTRTDTIMGTPAYMAPEQLSRGSVDRQLDQYALGVICYELVSGKLPYQADSAMGLFSEILGQPPILLRQRNPELSAELEKVLDRMLSKQPDQRYPDIEGAWQAIRPHLPT